MVPTGAAPSLTLGRGAIINKQIVNGEVFTKTSPNELMGLSPEGVFQKTSVTVYSHI